MEKKQEIRTEQLLKAVRHSQVNWQQEQIMLHQMTQSDISIM